ncbi:MAG TPA: CDGSH iron-sulfur domain-containing protein [Acidobacteriota bacterium]|nr:CDGSH iron-sulfur domain-containing protein [Acidobacteriota bacterium]
MDPGKIKIKLIRNGPAFVECEEAEISRPDESTETKKGKFALCRCGHSKNKPYCDGSHQAAGFQG